MPIIRDYNSFRSQFGDPIVGKRYNIGADPKYGDAQYLDPTNSKVKSWTTQSSAGDQTGFTWKDGQLMFPVWMQPQDETKALLDQANNPTSGSGTDYKYFADILKNYISQGDPNQALYKQGAMGDVNKTYDKGATTLRENLAGSGMFRSGVGQNAFATLEGGRSSAVAGVDTALAAKDQSFRQDALKNLLGLFGQETSQNQSWKEFLMNLRNNQSQFDWQKDQTENNNGAWGQIAGGLAQGAGTAATAALFASDARLKENVRQVSISQEGIPVVEFNYKGHKEKYRGVIAQDVEKIVPDAVIEIDGYKHVNYDKLSVKFEAI